MNIDFETGQNIGRWVAVNDGVMGGRSSGGPAMADDFMVFEGVINTNGGGFSSVRRAMPEGALSGTDGFMMTVRSDGRSYKFTMRSDARYRFRTVSFQAPIPPTPAGEWAEVFVPFDNLSASIFGRTIYGAKFNVDAVNEIGIILADGVDGPFRLDVKAVRACAAPTA